MVKRVLGCMTTLLDLAERMLPTYSKKLVLPRTLHHL
jgi:hypothetical protein